jgi:ABC-type proline/glycine betaine transport system ATPase subunit
MYLKHFNLQNVGPVQDLNYALPFDDKGRPKSLVLVGPNGSGKSIVLSFIANAILSTHQVLFENGEVEAGKVYKFRSPGYIRSGADHYFAKLAFDEEIEVVEWQLRMTRKSYEEKGLARPEHKSWAKISEDETSVLWSNMDQKKRHLEKKVSTTSDTWPKLLHFWGGSNSCNPCVSSTVEAAERWPRFGKALMQNCANHSRSE